ncbi:MAG: (d)CMP kinase [bacterium]|nr:(d)CMP kinase [bacterium]
MNVAEQIQKMVTDGVLIIAIDGHGGSGKSSLGRMLGEKLHATVFHTDDFASWDNPTEWYEDMIEQVFIPIENGVKTLSYELSVWEKGKSRGKIENQPVTNIIIVEGVGASRAEFRKYLDFSILVDVPESICIERGVSRDLADMPHKSKTEIRKLWLDWMEEERKYFSKHQPKENADVILDGTKSFAEQID